MAKRLIALALAAVLAPPLGVAPVAAQPVGQPVAELCRTEEERETVERIVNIGGLELEAPDECVRLFQAWLLQQPAPERAIALTCEAYVKHNPGTPLGECGRDITASLRTGGR